MNKFKYSGIDWIGEIPEYWEVKTIKDIFDLKGGGSDKKINFDEPLVRLVNFVDVFKKVKLDNKFNYMNVSCQKNKIKEISLKKDDLLITPSSETPDEIGLTNIVLEDLINTVFSYHILRLRCKNKNIDIRFTNYYFNSKFAANQFKIKATGTTRVTLSRYDINSNIIFLPPLQQQTVIANYLDQETSKIDRKIDILSQKLEKLEEYKKSIIFETVTKGLDKNVAMKDSGIDWIGEIPEHWEVKRVKEVAKWQTGFTPDTKKSEYYDGNNDWITIGDMDGKYIKESKNKINGSMFPKNWITPANSLLFSFKLSIGQVAFNEKDVFTNEAICSFSPKSHINLKYFYYAAPIFIVKNAKKNIYGADLLNQELISNAYIINLTQNEQEQIANYLDIETLKIYKKKSIIKKQIDLLKEYKQTIIYEVVTGKKECI